MERIIIGSVLAICLMGAIRLSTGCNEAICASVVSKCMLTQSCKCDLKDCSCCKECFSCLSYLYSECCSCVDMCPKPNETMNELSRKQSHVEDLRDSVPGLFAALTSEPDLHNRWLSFTFPVDFDIAQYAPAKEPEVNYHLQSVEQEAVMRTNIVTLNCTVAFMSQCLSCDKCRASCQSMGSTSLRWFHDGCCECIGDKCINYGINETRCLACPEGKLGSDLDNDLPDNVEDMVFGEQPQDD